MPLFLGLDLSTQSLKATITTERDRVVFEKAYSFQRDFPQYGTSNGAIAGPDDGEMTCPVGLWVETLDALMEEIVKAGVDVPSIVAVSGAAQQHGSVYWTEEAENLLLTLQPSKPLTSQLVPTAFSIPNAPIWQDSSTTAECRDLEAAVGGAQALANLTGSRAYERFTASQILKVRTKKPDAYAKTARISLVSSFIATLFLCRFAPIEVSDASGMNLMDIFTGAWDDKVLEAVSGGDVDGLKKRLGPDPKDVLGGVSLGTVGDWWVKKYGFSKNCIVAPLTGDNPSTIVTLSSPGDAILSLGTSTTLLVSIPPASEGSSSGGALGKPVRSTASHILAHPTTKGGFIYMLCYKNGGLTREHIQKTYSQGSWPTFNSQIESTSPGSLIGFYFTLKEIIPDGVQGDYFFRDGKKIGVEDVSGEEHPRAVVESQIVSVRVRLEETLGFGASVPAPAPNTTTTTTTTTTTPSGGGDPDTEHHHEHIKTLRRVILTGGSSHNKAIQQLTADILSLPIYITSNSASAASGGALLAKFAWWKRQSGNEGRPFEDMRREYGELELECVATPRKELEGVYDGVVEVFKRCEEEVVREYRARSGQA